MSKIFLRLGICLVFISIFYIGIGWLINNTYLYQRRVAVWLTPQFQRKGGVEYKISHDNYNTKDIDVIVIGSSHAYRGYDPREFEQAGLTLMNYGSAFQNTVAGYILVKDLIKPQSHQLLLIDIFNQTFEGDGIGCYTRLIENVDNDKTAFEFVSNTPDIRLLNSFSCRLFSKYSPIEIEPDSGYVKSGYYQRNDTLSTMPAIDSYKPKFNSRFFVYLEEIIDYCRTNSVTPILVSHPQPTIESNLTYHLEFLKKLQPYINEKKVTYLDYNNDKDFNIHEHFIDERHLNQAGVTKFNQILLKDLKHFGLIS